ncbi:hypothetical protein H8356DRAFT_1082390 [Neocallimastix lanati (nom. inval.)]|nr:hypothetical protein H8356DRAFT_1082390 [Neocallimastix sp. JGI-2020a]
MYVIAYIRNIILILLYLKIIKSIVTTNADTKEEILKMKDNYYTNYYCKNDICVGEIHIYNDNFIDIPDENGNITKYNVGTCTQDYIDTDDCNGSECSEDSECLSNKCYKNHCIFYDETPIVHCSNIYKRRWFLDPTVYMYCGKAPDDTCNEDNECSSKHCANNTCQSQTDGPSDSDGVQSYFEALIIIGVLIIVIIIAIIIGCCCYNKKKYKK